ncbi:MAG TPA: hypothetical protein VGM03_19620, partial [Phycisphaerae bacterium]
MLAPLALVVLVYDGFFASFAIAAAAGAALWLIPVLRLGPLPLRWQLLLASALGLGGLSALVLGLGLVGLLQRGLWFLILAALAAIGLLRVRLLWKEGHAAKNAPEADGSNDATPWNWLSLIIVPFAVLALDVATVPPGFLWTPEGFGYDALEYHLELPKEYAAQQRIAYTPHNVYGNFPANVEMLYLLSMVLRGDPIDGAMTGQMFNLAFAILTVAAVWVAAREWSARAAAAAVLLIGTVTWLPYLCGVAFVENGLLFFTAVACAALLRGAVASPLVGGADARAPGTRPDATVRSKTRWIAVSGVMAGLAAGCKYTGVTLVALPIGIAVLLLPAYRSSDRFKRGAIFASTALLTFAPWMIKNAVFTGNPVFPLANEIFRAYPPGWGEAESRHFEECHRPLPAQRSLSGRLRELWHQVIADESGLFGPLLLLAPLTLTITRPRTGRAQTARFGSFEALLIAVLAIQVLAWLLGTHLYARFSVVWVIPLALLGGRGLAALRAPAVALLAGGLALAGAGLNLARFVDLYQRHFSAAGHRIPIEGATQVFTNGEFAGFEHLALINRELPPDVHILMLGDAKAFYFQRPVDYCVVFNRNPFVETVRSSRSPQEIV